MKDSKEKWLKNLILFKIEMSKKILYQDVPNITTNISKVNRIYYAVFNIATALLLLHNLSFKTHTGALTLFEKEFIKTGLLEKKYGKIYRHLFNQRQYGDYIAFNDFAEQEVEAMFQMAEEFITGIEKLIFRLNPELSSSTSHPQGESDELT